MDARAEILTRIGSANVPATRSIRTPVVASDRSRDVIVHQFAEYAAEYKANVVFSANENLSETLVRLLPREGFTVVPTDLPVSWLPEGLSRKPDLALSIAEIDEAVAVLTGCAVAIAETGTVVLDTGPAQGRRAITLIPDHHVCVVFADQIVDSVPEAVERLAEAASAGRPQTWISGPSATSDIELIRVEGVHGPRRLDIVIVSSPIS